MTVPGIGADHFERDGGSDRQFRKAADARRCSGAASVTTAWGTVADGSDLDLASDVLWGPGHFLAMPAAIAMFR